MKELAREIVRRMPELTYKRSAQLALENAGLNRPYLHHTVFDLPGQSGPKASDVAIVIGAGPSLHTKKSVSRILGEGYTGTTICADGALGHCLRNGLVPDYLLTLDPHPTRVVRWFGDPNLTSTGEDDYFRRQEMDPYLGDQELVKNQELVRLVDQHGPKIKAIIATCASQPVTKRCLDAGMDLFWWNPIFDDIESAGSLTRALHRSNGIPCMASGGNVGSASWVFGNAMLKKKEIALVGMDLGYTPETPKEKTQYYKEISDLFGPMADQAYIDVHNPYLKETWFTDPAYFWYREAFLTMAQEADCKTFNCTEGGILFGRGVQFVTLKEFLASVRAMSK